MAVEQPGDRGPGGGVAVASREGELAAPIAPYDSVPAGADEGARPTRILPISHLLRISAYWLGLTSVMTGLTAIINYRIQWGHITAKGTEGMAGAEISIVGWLIAVSVQPTIGSISDYTISRWGRRKPYIVIGSTLDLLFLYGVGASNSILAIAAFVALLQFSSNFAQGPFQGYVPDLVAESQVGVASGLMGMFSTLGNVIGFFIGAVTVGLAKTDPNAYLYGLLVLGAIEFATMLSVVLRVDEGRRAKPRDGKSWRTIAREVWATDILGDRDFAWLVGSRFFILTAGSCLTMLSGNYLGQTFHMDESAASGTLIVLLGFVTVATLASVVPASRMSDAVGRKPVIYVSCAAGAVGLTITALSPAIEISMAGVVLFGVSLGTFMAVDWALMTDIVPKASAGRYMGISNLATASAGQAAVIVAGALVMDNVNRLLGIENGYGPRAAQLLGVACFVIGAFLLRNVRERRRPAAAVRLAAQAA